MSRRTRLPHCFYCNEPTNEAVSRIDGQTPVCVSCSYFEKIDPRTAYGRWIALGGDRAAALVFAQQLDTHHIPARQAEIGAAL